MEQKDKLGTKRACMTCGREFDWETTVCPDDNTPLTALGEEDQLVGTTLADRYEILEVIGGGGMGLVYKARHKLMNRIVAIKMLHKHMISSKDTLKRFQLEAQAASCLSLPNILTVYDFGLTSEGQPYMVMDYLEGTSLADVLEAEHHVVPERAVSIFIQACAGLAHAHQKGVLHRDIKPSNIMLVNFGDQADFVKIVDFGIAKLLNQGVGELTKTGEVYGSPSYMSPEQCRGKETDARSDIYSMGCVMYRTLSGRPLFSGDDIIELLFKQVSEPPAPFDPDLNIPAELEAVIFKALAKDAGDRYQTMGEFKEALEKYVDKRSGKAVPTPTVEGPMPLWKRHGEAPSAPSATASSTSNSAVAAGNNGATSPAAASSAAAAAKSKPTSSTPAPATPPAVSEPPGPVFEATRHKDSKSRPSEPSPAPASAPAAAMRDEQPARSSGSRSSSQTISAPDTKHGASSHLRQKMAGGNKVLLVTIAAVSAVVLCVVGFLVYKNSQSGAPQQTTAAPGGSDQVTANLPDANAQAAFMSGKESFKSKKYEDAKIEFEEALDVTEKGSGMNSRELVPILTELGFVYRKLDKLTLAESTLRRAIPIQEHAGGKNDLMLANLNFQLAQVLHESGRPKDADKYGRTALSIKKIALSTDNPQVGEIQTFLSSNLPGSTAAALKGEHTSKPVGPPADEHPPTTAIATPPKNDHPTPPVTAPVTAPPKTEHPSTDVAPPAKTEKPPAPDTAPSTTPPSPPTTAHTAAPSHHASHARHSSGGGHKSSAAPPVRHRRAYSSYGF
ncbi:MAG: protein kinase [Cyanobacteria bacterium SZAS-4]|nr:protein kinase [Cyanobacteria bacterium SZAS-4]